MSDLRNIYHPEQEVIFLNHDFDAVKKEIDCKVLEVEKDKMVILDIETDTKLYIERGFSLDLVKMKN